MEVLIMFVIVFWIVPIFLAANIWENKGGGKGAGVALGLFLGWLGVLIAAIASPSGGGGSSRVPVANSRECPHCKSRIRRDASVCPHCQRESSPWIFHEGRWWMTGTDGKIYYSDGVVGKWIEYKQEPQLTSSHDPSSAPPPPS